MPRLANAQDKLPEIPQANVRWWSDFKSSNPMDNWDTDISGYSVDLKRTAGLANIIQPVRCTRNDNDKKVPIKSGTPLQKASTKFTKTYEANAKPSFLNWFPSQQLPLPDVVYILSNTDEQWYAIDDVRGLYYEANALGPTPFNWPAPWRADKISVWDLSVDWRKQTGKGTSAIKVPIWPMIPKMENLLSGKNLNHSLHLVAAGYQKDEKVGIARGTDGPLLNHPLRAGERLRLRADRVPPARNIQERTLISAMLTYGLIVSDRTRWDELSPGHSIRLPIDPRIDLDLDLNITDFEVILQ